MSKNILVGITGTVSAYNALFVINKLQQEGYNLHIIINTDTAKMFNIKLFEALTPNKVYINDWAEHANIYDYPEFKLIDIILIIPANCNFVSDLATAKFSSPLNSFLSYTTIPTYLVAYIEHSKILGNAIFKENLEKIHQVYPHIHMILPEDDCNSDIHYYGKKIVDEEAISDYIALELSRHKSILKGKKILITAGKTEEYVDSNSFITNKAKGTIGISMAKAAVEYGADVTLICALTEERIPASIKNVVNVKTFDEMQHILSDNVSKNDIIISTASITDYRPEKYLTKDDLTKNNQLNINFNIIPNMLLPLKKKFQNKIFIGLSRESADDIINSGLEKIERLNLDFLVAEDINFTGTTQCSPILINSEQQIITINKTDRSKAAYKIIEEIAKQIFS